MANVTQGLFGFNPALQQEEALNTRAQQFAAQSPAQAARAAMFRAGSQLGGAVGGLMGAKDPELEAQSLMKQTAATLDLNDHKAVRDVANKWMQSGNQTLQNKALQLNEVADKAEHSTNQRIKEKADLDLSARKQERQQAFSTEYAAAPDQETRLAVTRKYADMPDLIKMDEASLARKEKADDAALARKEKAEAAAEAAKLKREDAALQSQLQRENQRFIAGQGALSRASSSKDALTISENVKATALQEKVQEKSDKQKELDAKADRSAIRNIAHADQMMLNAQEARSLVKYETTGRTGQVAAALNTGGEAGVLRNRLATIKANLGFDRLQRMRDESPTGGALGTVAVQELEALQASVASLSPMQSAEELNKSLTKIENHYNAWKATVVEDSAARKKRRTDGPAITIRGATSRNAPTSPSGWGVAVEN